jgi:hypothetical protein
MSPSQRRGDRSPPVALNTLSESADVRSRQVSGVCDLALRPGPFLCGRPRTAANETGIETGAALALAIFRTVRGRWSTVRPGWLPASESEKSVFELPALSLGGLAELIQVRAKSRLGDADGVG